MPARRDADGNLVIEESKKVGNVEVRPDEPTAPRPGRDAVPSRPAPAAGTDPYEARTVTARSRAGADPTESAGDARTRLYRPRTPPTEAAPAPAAAGPPSAAMDDPPAGWLVVVRGPGQGNVLTVGHGANAIGREPDERIRIDFGDETISRRGHATVTYDPRGKTFYVQHGGGKNLTYLEDAPVLAPTKLPGFSRIQVGDTLLLFVPLCGERFDWESEGA